MSALRTGSSPSWRSTSWLRPTFWKALRNSLRIGAVLGTFALVAAFILVQQVSEASAEQDFHAARAQVIAAQARASELGLENAEFSDLQRQDLTTASETPPVASAPFNEERIAFFSRAA